MTSMRPENLDYNLIAEDNKSKVLTFNFFLGINYWIHWSTRVEYAIIYWHSASLLVRHKNVIASIIGFVFSDLFLDKMMYIQHLHIL